VASASNSGNTVVAGNGGVPEMEQMEEQVEMVALSALVDPRCWQPARIWIHRRHWTHWHSNESRNILLTVEMTSASTLYDLSMDVLVDSGGSRSIRKKVRKNTQPYFYITFPCRYLA